MTGVGAGCILSEKVLDIAGSRIDKDFVTYFEIRSGGVSCISEFLVALLGHGDFSFESTL